MISHALRWFIIIAVGLMLALSIFVIEFYVSAAKPRTMQIFIAGRTHAISFL